MIDLFNDRKAIIDEVARRHNIRLAPDDPILATVTVTEIIHQLFAEHLKALVADVANQATDRLAAQIETGRREVTCQSDAAKATSNCSSRYGKTNVSGELGAFGLYQSDRTLANSNRKFENCA